MSCLWPVLIGCHGQAMLVHDMRLLILVRGQLTAQVYEAAVHVIRRIHASLLWSIKWMSSILCPLCSRVRVRPSIALHDDDELSKSGFCNKRDIRMPLT